VGNLGFTEIMVILLVVLLLFGAKRLPEVGSSIGKGIRAAWISVNPFYGDEATQEFDWGSNVATSNTTGPSLWRYRATSPRGAPN